MQNKNAPPTYDLAISDLASNPIWTKELTKIVVSNPEFSLADGAEYLWPDTSKGLSKKMLNTFCQATGIPSDTPIVQLNNEQRRIVFDGTADRWFDVLDEFGRRQLSFQYKGLHSSSRNFLQPKLSKRPVLQSHSKKK